MDAIVNKKILCGSVGPKGPTHGSYDDNYLLNSVWHKIEFIDELVKEQTTKITDDNIVFRVDRHRLSMTIIESIADYMKNDLAVDLAYKHVITPNVENF